ncbi:MAG: hypothetical protein ACKVOQ_13680 [Cyclobacteriaceae bacterium]
MASKIADALEVGLDFMLGKTTAELDKKTLDRLQQIQKLPEEEQKIIYKVLDSCETRRLSRLMPKTKRSLVGDQR